MAPTIAEQGGTLLVRKLPVADPMYCCYYLTGKIGYVCLQSDVMMFSSPFFLLETSFMVFYVIMANKLLCDSCFHMLCTDSFLIITLKSVLMLVSRSLFLSCICFVLLRGWLYYISFAYMCAVCTRCTQYFCFSFCKDVLGW